MFNEGLDWKIQKHSNASFSPVLSIPQITKLLIMGQGKYCLWSSKRSPVVGRQSSRSKRTWALKLTNLGLDSWPCHGHAVWPWSSHFASQGLNFIIYKMRIKLPVLGLSWGLSEMKYEMFIIWGLVYSRWTSKMWFSYSNGAKSVTYLIQIILHKMLPWTRCPSKASSGWKTFRSAFCQLQFPLL